MIHALLFTGALTRTTHLVFGGEVAPPEVSLRDDISACAIVGYESCDQMTTALGGIYDVAQSVGLSASAIAQIEAPVGYADGDQWQPYAALTDAYGALWQQDQGVTDALGNCYQVNRPAHGAAVDLFGDALPTTYSEHARNSRYAAPASISRSSRFGTASSATRSQCHQVRPASPLHRMRNSRYQADMPAPPGFWRPDPVIRPEPVSHDLLFRDRLTRTTHLIFGRAEPGAIVIPILRTYIVINDVSLLRLPENIPLQAYDLSLAWDMDRWSVNWSATLPAASLDAVMPDSVGSPVELQATMNGIAIRLLAESIGRDRRFGDARIKVSGRGRVAWLASPYAATVSRTNDTLLTAQQLADAALSINGVSIGWGLDWQIADWSVPAGVWSHAGAHIEAVQRIAEAAGGYVLGHRTNQTLHVRKRYPLLPWEWSAATPDVVIPAAVASTESIAWTEKPSYNRVFVSGEAGGILGDVKRAGTAGDLAAQMVTDSLITAEAAARARGGAILADTGRQASISIQMPVLEETGILDLGQLVEYNDGTQAYRGLVRSVSVRAALPQVWQTVEIETHG